MKLRHAAKRDNVAQSVYTFSPRSSMQTCSTRRPRVYWLVTDGMRFVRMNTLAFTTGLYVVKEGLEIVADARRSGEKIRPLSLTRASVSRLLLADGAERFSRFPAQCQGWRRSRPSLPRKTFCLGYLLPDSSKALLFAIPARGPRNGGTRCHCLCSGQNSAFMGYNRPEWRTYANSVWWSCCWCRTWLRQWPA